jgi:group I intron endonuclease
MKISGIYAITHNESGRRYIGSAANIYLRWECHKSDLRKGRHTNTHLQRLWNKSGQDAFSFVVIEECPREFLLDREQVHINEKSELNILRVAGSRIGRKHTPETCAKFSAAKKGKPLSVEHLAKLSLASAGKPKSKEHNEKNRLSHLGEKHHLFGKHHSEESKAKIKASLLARKYHHTPEARAKIGAAASARMAKEDRTGADNAFYGKHHTPESKAKLAAARIGKPLSPETRAKIAIASTGRIATKETRAKLSASLKGRTITPEWRERLSKSKKAWWSSHKGESACTL